MEGGGCQVGSGGCFLIILSGLKSGRKENRQRGDNRLWTPVGLHNMVFSPDKLTVVIAGRR